MIKNERQYKITRAQAARLRDSLEVAKKRMGGDVVEPLELSASGIVREPPARYGGVHPLIAKAQEDAMNSQLADLESELTEYETLKAGSFDLDALGAVGDIPMLLIKARIAKGLSQKELAERLGLKEQQIQRYEATEYAQASLTRITGGGGGLWGGGWEVALEGALTPL